jgi:uncharacterized protein (TIGR02594 family)
MTRLPWMQNAEKMIGLAEIVGPRHNPTILGWARTLSGQFGAWIRNLWKTDEVAWCGLFVAITFFNLKMKVNGNFPSARAWANWGLKCRPCYGAVLVFARKGGGHVGFYVSETATHYNVLGGNQGNKVSIMAIDKDRCIAARWPSDTKEPVGPQIFANAAQKSDGNEK